MAKISIDKALKQGIKAHRSGNLKEADRLYSAVLRAQPKHSAANHNMGRLAVSIGKVQLALSFFKIALETDASTPQYWLSYIETLARQGRLSEAKALLLEAKNKGIQGDSFYKLETLINSPVAILKSNIQEVPSGVIKRVTDLYSQGQVQETLIQASKLLPEFPCSATLQNIIGAAHDSLGNYENAVEAYRQATNINPNYFAAFLNLGNTFKKMGKLEEATEAYEKVVSISPDYEGAHNNLGVALHEQGKFTAAIKAYRQAITLKPDYADAYNNLGVTFNEIREIEKSIEAYKKAISLVPDYIEAHNNMGIALKEQGKTEEAITAFNKAISLKPDYAEAYNNKGIALKEQGKLEEAIDTFSKAIAINPKYYNAFNNMGSALRDAGRLNESVTSLQKAFSLRCKIIPNGDKVLAPATTALHFELTNKCNFHCTFCPSDFQKRALGSMDVALVKKLYAEAAEKNIAPVVNLHLMGEPTLHPNLIEILDFGASKNIKTDLVTNGSTLVAKIVPKILDTLYGTITASHMTPTKETYHFRGKVGLSWERYISNLRLLVREYMKRIATGDNLKNVLTIRVMTTMDTAANCSINESADEAYSILKEWVEFVATVEDELGLERFERASYDAEKLLDEVNGNYVTYALQKGINLKFWKAFTFANTRVSDDYVLEDSIDTTYCPKPFTDVGVLWNGDVTLCDLDHDGKLAVGNINDTSLEEIIQNDAAKKLRASMLGRCSLPSICKVCQAKPVKIQSSKNIVPV